MQPVRQRLLKADSIFFRMRANDLEAVIKPRKEHSFEGSFRKQNLQGKGNTETRKERIDNSVRILT